MRQAETIREGRREMTQLGRKREDADYGVGEYSFDSDELGLVDPSDLTERLVSLFHDPGYHPPRLPSVATELLALSQDKDVEFGRLESLLEQDAVLAGEVLSIARSAYYAGVAQVRSLNE